MKQSAPFLTITNNVHWWGCSIAVYKEQPLLLASTGKECYLKALLHYYYKILQKKFLNHLKESHPGVF